jgi:hypothetical protein
VCSCVVPVQAHGLVGNPNGFKVRVNKQLRRSSEAYSTVERVKHLRSGPTLVNAGGHLGRPGV